VSARPFETTRRILSTDLKTFYRQSTLSVVGKVDFGRHRSNITPILHEAQIEMYNTSRKRLKIQKFIIIFTSWIKQKASSGFRMPILFLAFQDLFNSLLWIILLTCRIYRFKQYDLSKLITVIQHDIIGFYLTQAGASFKQSSELHFTCHNKHLHEI
jgi:hypothetical protein